MDVLANEAVRRLKEEISQAKLEAELLQELNDTKREITMLRAQLKDNEPWSPIVPEGGENKPELEQDLIDFSPPTTPVRPRRISTVTETPVHKSTPVAQGAVSGATLSATCVGVCEGAVGGATSSNQESDVIRMLSVFVNQLNLSRLPAPEPGVFYGDPLQYSSWHAAFETLIESRGIPPSEQMHYLRRYLGGAAKDAVQGYFLVNTEEAFLDAKKLLHERFGDDYVVANAFRKKLGNFEKFPRDRKAQAKSLREFSDYLRQCEALMKTNRNMEVLNDPSENQKMLEILPDWLVTRWGRSVGQWKELVKQHPEMKPFPPFGNFVRFIEQEAELINDPHTSLQALRGDKPGDSKPATSFKKPNTAKSMNTLSEPTPSKISFRVPCVLCQKDNHQLDTCRQFLAKNLTDRKQYARDHKLCYGCLRGNHKSKFCRNRLTCKVCGKAHPTSLHGDIPPPPKTEIKAANSESQAQARSGLTHKNGRPATEITNLSSLVVPVWVSHQGEPLNERLVYAMLDTQSDTTFVLDKTCEALGVTGTPTKLKLSTMFAENRLVNSSRVTGLVVRGYQRDVRIRIPVALSREIMPANKDHIPTPEKARQWPHLQRVAEELMPLSQCEVGLLIGYNNPEAMKPLEVVTTEDGHENSPYAVRTPLGWGIIGPTSTEITEPLDSIGFSHRIITCPVSPTLSSDTQVETHLVFPNQVKEIVNILETDFQESRPSTSLSIEDKQFMSLMEDGIRHGEDGYYEMPLPFKGKDPCMPSNRTQALKRLNQIGARFRKDTKFCQDYTTFMQSIIENGEAEEVPKPELEKSDGRLWYIPHFGIYSDKKPEKIRVVFDCSATYGDTSLNQKLLQGPDLNNSLLGVLLRFRSEVCAVSCDVKRMFHQFRVQPAHRDYLRFLWWPEGNFNKDPVDYRMRVHIFGAKSSPACCSFGLKQIAKDYKDECGKKAAEFVMNSFYVDDGLTAEPSISETKDLIQNTQKMVGKGNLELHKIQSNSPEVLEEIPETYRASQPNELPCIKDGTSYPLEKALGVHWCVEADAFKFRITLKDKPLTRRGVLSTVGSIYDPLGLVAPVLLPGRQIFQELCKLNADWDSALPEHLQAKWEKWRNSLPLLESLEIKRCYKPKDFGEVKRVELHHMSDASSQAYGQCSYLRLVNVNGLVYCSLVMGKSRVAPLKTVTIPRLELTAAVLSVNVSQILHKELNYKLDEEIFWTDSQVVLGYIQNEARRFHVFVSNRVQHIRDHTDPAQWRHVPGEQNAADEASRGLHPKQLLTSAKWLTGPDFLWKSILPAPQDPVMSVSEDDPEVKRAQVHALGTGNTSIGLEPSRFECFSSWYRAKRAMARCLEYKTRLKTRLHRNSDNLHIEYKQMKVGNLNEAEREIIKIVQEKSFSEEIGILRNMQINAHTVKDDRLARERNVTLRKTSNIYRLDPYVDKEGVLRVGGRITRANMPLGLKHPVIMPRNGHLTTLLIRHCHEAVKHQGRGMTINKIREEGFWIVGCRDLVSKYIESCFLCRLLRSHTVQQKMGDLPKDRLEAAPPFTFCGVDIFGHFMIKEGRKEMKRWGVLFTCLASRAIHVETVNTMNTDSFINALRRFIAIRGPIKLLRSDRGTNITGADNELKDAWSEMDLEVIRNFLLTEEGNFEFIPRVPKASWQSGCIERLILSVRSILSTLLQQYGRQLDDESLRTLLLEAMAVVNCRPLTTNDLEDPTSLQPLTPNQLLTMKSRVVASPPGVFPREDLYLRKRWRRVQYIANEFWSRWRKEYLQNLQVRNKWNRPKRNLAVGDIVLLQDDDTPRNLWRLARVEQTYPSEDNLVRNVKIALGDRELDNNGKRKSKVTYLDRPVQKLVLLLEADGGIDPGNHRPRSQDE